MANRAPPTGIPTNKPYHTMDTTSKHQANSSSNDLSILHSETVKARQRIYYIDVKRDRNGDYYLSLTESKKVNAASAESQATFEKHKLFLYSEDMKRFSKALAKAMDYISLHENEASSTPPSWDGPFSPDDITGQSSAPGIAPDVEPSADNYRQNVDF